MASIQPNALSNHLMVFVKYFLASLVALFIDYAVYWLLATESSLGLPTSAVIGYGSGLIVAYVLMVNKVFKNGWLGDRKRIEFLMFLASGLLGMLLTYSSVSIAIVIIGQKPTLSKACAVTVSFIGVYLFRKLVVFRPVQ